jgi:hypothetical protein
MDISEIYTNKVENDTRKSRKRRDKMWKSDERKVK